MSERQVTNCDWALAYARIGWPVFPVWSCREHGDCRCGRPNTDKGHSAGKHPHRLAPHGHHDATTDEDAIRRWWEADPDAGIGIDVCRAGLVVLDIDPRNGGDATLGELERLQGPMRSAVTAATQGGGQHRLFVAPAGFRFPASVGPGLDLKTTGYICVEPTRGPQGGYCWLEGRSPVGEAPAVPSQLPDYIATLGRTQVDRRTLVAAPIVTEDQWRQIGEAMPFIDAGNYTTWALMGLALRPYGERGFGVWDVWSRSCADKYDAAEARRKWEHGFADARGDVTYKTIFKMALDGGWQGPVADAARRTLTPWQPLPWTEFTLRPIDYLVDDFLARSLMTLAGKPGMGKTTVMVSLCAIAAGLNLPGSGLRAPTRGRKIVYITEDTEQLYRQLIALNRNFGIPLEGIKEAFSIVPAYRAKPSELAGLEPLVEEMTVRIDGVELRPWVIFDTTSASFCLEEENSNSEVAAMLAELKSRYYEKMSCSLCLVAHTSKNASRDLLFDPRGAGAWTGDTTLTAGIYEDGGCRYLMLGKRRYSPLYTRVAVTLVSADEEVQDQYGRQQTVRLNSALLTWADDVVADSRVITPEALAERAADAVLAFIVAESRVGRCYSVGELTKPEQIARIGFSRDTVRAAVKRLDEQGHVQRPTGRKGSSEGWKVVPTPAGILRAQAAVSGAEPAGRPERRL